MCIRDRGEPIRILDLARNMIRLAGFEPDVDVAIEFTGIRPGEKIHEELMSADERAEPTEAPRIQRAVRSAPVDIEWVEATVDRLEELVRSSDEAGLGERIVALISGERPETSVELDA